MTEHQLVDPYGSGVCGVCGKDAGIHERNPIRQQNEEYEGIVQGVTGPKCDDCGVTYEEPPYYSFEPDACTFIEDDKVAADDEHGCTGNLCVDCADELFPDDLEDPRTPEHIRAYMKK